MARAGACRGGAALRRAVLALALALGTVPLAAGAETAAPVPDRTPDTVDTPLPVLRIAGLRAFQAGDLDLALRIAEALVAAAPGDSFGHFLAAQIAAQRGDAGPALRAAARAHDTARTPVQRHQSAELAAAAALKLGRTGRAARWAETAAAAAPDPARAARDRAIAARLRAASPWRGQLSFGFTPSSNVNGGARDRFNVIDGVPVVGILSGDAQALSGVIGALDASARYRLGASARARTDLRGRLSIREVRLSDSARAQAPGARGSDFASASAEIGLSHLRSLDAQTAVTLDLGMGRAWEAAPLPGPVLRYDPRQPSYDFVTASAGLRRKLGGGLADLSAGLERRIDAQNALDDAHIRRLALGWTGDLRLGGVPRGQLGLSWSVETTDTDRPGFDHVSRRLMARLVPVLPAGLPLGLALSAGTEALDYRRYNVGFIPVPGGRHDTMIFADAEIWSDRLDMAGFSPRLRLRSLSVSSNVSRFERSELSLGLGLRHSF
ncbi:hypothetical protein SAMN05878426_10321 [Phaeovulum vinaykumarii]|uniref:Tetratricopeptide repeat-containing protein n=2 Tax=Phaeovulum vinaykumarii TaxID=407234 RepID=A0A1N7LGM8_9RHOB|nr:hypothetical protein SAMN05421795_10321 [Phaeovulum vinaykumarii]SOC04572.1 hypothetical protein SAMN05878426_10321 [Phaeovulum vinaykumarii]